MPKTKAEKAAYMRAYYANIKANDPERYQEMRDRENAQRRGSE